MILAWFAVLPLLALSASSMAEEVTGVATDATRHAPPGHVLNGKATNHVETQRPRAATSTAGGGHRLGKNSDGSTTQPKRNVDEPVVCPIGSNSFVAGTLVLTDEGLEPIESVVTGDLVWAWNEEEQIAELAEVGETFSSVRDELVVLQIGDETITATPEHPFHVEGRGWIDAAELEPGDAVTTTDGSTLGTVSLERIASPAHVYNYEVTTHNNYSITPASLLVHNCTEVDTISAADAKWLRSKSPSPEIRDLVNSGQRVQVRDPAVGVLTERLAADHIVPLNEIVQMPGFAQLSRAQMLEVANYRRNFAGLAKRVNSSKGARDYFEWKEYKRGGKLVNPRFARKMQRKTQILRAELQQMINEFLD